MSRAKMFATLFVSSFVGMGFSSGIPGWRGWVALASCSWFVFSGLALTLQWAERRRG